MHTFKKINLSLKELSDRVLPDRNEYFLSRHFHRKISVLITFFLLKTKISANTVTKINFIISLIGCGFFLNPSYAFWFVGAIIYQLTHILDGVDGEIARFRKTVSKKGALLDDLRHNVTNAFLFLSLGRGLSLIYNQEILFVIGSIGAIIVLLNDILNKILPSKNIFKNRLLRMKFQKKSNKTLEFIRGLFTFGVLGYLIILTTILDMFFGSYFSTRIILLFLITGWEILLFFNKIDIFLNSREEDFIER